MYIGGVLSDKFEPKSLRTKSLIAGTSLLGTSICYFCMFYPFISVWFPLGFVAVNSLLFEGFSPPAVSMMTATASVGKSPIIGVMMAAVGSA